VRTTPSCDNKFRGCQNKDEDKIEMDRRSSQASPTHYGSLARFHVKGSKEREEAEKGGDIRDFLASYIRLLDYLYKGHLGFLNTRARA